MTGPRRQRGAVAVLGAVTAILGLIAVGLAVDLARLYAAQRSLQRVANMAALDASRLAGGCYGAAARGGNAQAAARDEARASLIRNGGDPSWIDSAGLVRLGRMRVEEGIRHFDPLFDENGAPIGALTAHDSVQVVLLRPSPPRLIPGLSRRDNRREMVAVASAMSRPVARFGVGSGLLGVDLSQSLLDPLLSQLLGGSPGISIVDYRNLFAAGLTVGELSSALEQGELGSLLLETVPAPQLVDAIAELVENVTTDLGGGVAGLNALLGITPDVAGIASDLTISVGQLASQALQQVAAGVPISIACPASLSALGLNCSGGTIQILDPGTPGEQGVPDTTSSDQGAATSGQVQIALPSVVINPLNTGIVSLNAAVDLTAARGRARVSDIQCPRAGRPFPVVRLRPQTDVAAGSLRVTGEIRLSLASLGISGLGLGLLPPVRIGISLDAPIEFSSGGQGGDLTFLLDDQHDRLTGLPSQRHPPANDLAVADALSAAVSNLDADLDITILNLGLLSAVSGLLTDALIEPVARSVLAPTLQTLVPTLEPAINELLNSLGVQLAYADYRVFDVTDGQPVLFQR